MLKRILVITGDHGAPDPTKPGERFNPEDLETHAAMQRALVTLGEFEFAFVSDHSRLFTTLECDRPDLVVNFCDTGFRNLAALELNVPAYLELLDLPYTGSPPAVLAVCFDKALVRLAAMSLGIPVPRETFLPCDAPVPELTGPFPLLLKPNRADGSFGITRDAVVRDQDRAIHYLEWLREAVPACDVLLQEYLTGPEYSIGLIGNAGQDLRALPALEVDFSRLPAGYSPILSYESKSLPDSPYWTQIRFERADLPAAVEQRLADWSRLLFSRLGLRDYGRFDFRADESGGIRLLEVNPNPAWANDGKLALMAGFAGMSYPDLLEAILRAAVARVTRSQTDAEIRATI